MQGREMALLPRCLLVPDVVPHCVCVCVCVCAACHHGFTRHLAASVLQGDCDFHLLRWTWPWQLTSKYFSAVSTKTVFW